MPARASALVLAPEIISPRHRLSIQGLRAIAVVTVVLFHAGVPLPGGFVGVDIFFVISGFVITAMLRREYRTSGRIRFARFYMRRFKRLAPALALMATVTVVVSAFVLSPFGAQQSVGWTAMGSALLTANVFIARTTGGYFDAPAETNPLLHTWSLSVEEQFYLFFPAVLAVAWWWSAGRGSPRTQALVAYAVGAVALTSFALVLVSSEIAISPVGSETLLGFYSPLTRAWEFAAGALLALAMTLWRWTDSAASIAGIVGLIALWASLWLISKDTPFPSVWTLLPVSATLLLLASSSAERGMSARLLSMKPLVTIGDWSYSIYLWHWPFIVFSTALLPDVPLVPLLAATISTGAAYASYRWVEQPIRTANIESARGKALLIIGTSVVPIATGAALVLLADSAYGNSDVANRFATAKTIPIGWGDPLCISRVPVSERDTSQCNWNSAASGVPIYLVGDSNAQHFSDGMIAAATELNRPLTTLGVDGCPLIDVHMRRRSDPSLGRECRPAYEALMDWLREREPGLVMISSDSRYWERDNDFSISPTGDFAGDSSESNEGVLTEGLVRTISELEKVGHQVVLLDTIPQFSGSKYKISESDCSGWNLMKGSCREALRASKMPLAVANSLQSGQRDSYRTAADLTGVSIYDFRAYFCGNGVCESRIDGVDHYMLDGYHLNKAGSSALRGDLSNAVNLFG